jgi:hypothetical protein
MHAGSCMPAYRSMHAGSCMQHAACMPVHACRFMHAGSCQLLLMRACARRAYCKKCRVNLGSKSSGWPNEPVLIIVRILFLCHRAPLRWHGCCMYGLYAAGAAGSAAAVRADERQTCVCSYIAAPAAECSDI